MSVSRSWDVCAQDFDLGSLSGAYLRARSTGELAPGDIVGSRRQTPLGFMSGWGRPNTPPRTD
eukprot:scaffold180946_cov25-Prasinocladus_malaysianus.AAC.1